MKLSVTQGDRYKRVYNGVSDFGPDFSDTVPNGANNTKYQEKERPKRQLRSYLSNLGSFPKAQQEAAPLEYNRITAYTEPSSDEL